MADSTSTPPPPPPPPSRSASAPAPAPEPFLDIEDLQRRRSFWRSPAGIAAGLGLGLAGLILVGLVSLGLGMEFGLFPDSVAVPGDELPEHVRGLLREEGILEASESVVYFYSAGVFDYREDGNVVTDRRVISYWQEEGGEFVVESAPYERITGVDVNWSESWLEDTEIRVTVGDADSILLWVSKEEGGDRKFHAELVRLWKAKRGRDH